MPIRSRELLERYADTTVKGDHSFACFYPIGTDEGAKALSANTERGHTAAGLKIRSKEEVI